jgi:hypothetical protein
VLNCLSLEDLVHHTGLVRAAKRTKADGRSTIVAKHSIPKGLKDRVD